MVISVSSLFLTVCVSLSSLVQPVEQLDLFGDMSTPPDLHSPTVSVQPSVSVGFLRLRRQDTRHTEEHCDTRGGDPVETGFRFEQGFSDCSICGGENAQVCVSTLFGVRCAIVPRKARRVCPVVEEVLHQGIKSLLKPLL